MAPIQPLFWQPGVFSCQKERLMFKKFYRPRPSLFIGAALAITAVGTAQAQTATEYMFANSFFEAVKAKLGGGKTTKRQVDWAVAGEPAPVLIEAPVAIRR